MNEHYRIIRIDTLKNANICRIELTKDEEKRLGKLEDIAARLKRGEHV